MNDPERIDELIDRFAAGALAAPDLAELAAAANTDPSVWRRCDAAATAHRALETGVRAAQTKAAAVELPSAHSGTRVFATVGGLGGWAAALLMAFVWLSGRIAPNIQLPDLVGTMPIVDRVNDTSELLFERYLEQGAAEGRILAVLPSRPLQVLPNPDGAGAIVRFERRLLEQAVVDGGVRLAYDEHGHPRLIEDAHPPVRENL